jgi:hypothetical protein
MSFGPVIGFELVTADGTLTPQGEQLKQTIEAAFDSTVRVKANANYLRTPDILILNVGSRPST